MVTQKRTFEVVVSMRISAESFGDAENKAHDIMGAGFNKSDGEYPSEFNTLAIVKGSKL